ncbi:UDP-N-acetylglucosamine 4,6-dehydratase family protein [Natrialbaceae archaeon A-arb3/5]
MKDLSGKNILVTGGCGSIGSYLVKEILEHDPAVVRVLDNNEEGLFKLKKELGAETPTRYLLGDIRDRDRLENAMENIDVVFHAAALKHVTLNEYNPFETVQTNVEGTQNLIQAALEEEVESFVAVSTDKASNPTSVMGATKLLSERLVIAANTYKGERDTRFGCVRFGNVLGSSGSVIPLFLDQIRSGGPVTVTDPAMTRFIMPIREAAQLVIEAHEKMTSGEIFVLKMPAFRVGTLAEAMIEEYAPKYGYDQTEINIKIIGSRPGERVHEKLISADETSQARELEDMYVILPEIELTGYNEVNYSSEKRISDEYTSEDTDILTGKETINLIENTIDGVNNGEEIRK